MQNIILRAGLLSSLLAASTLAQAHDHPVSRGRLIFADHEKAEIGVLDLDSYEVTHRLPVPKANPGFAPVEGGRYMVVKTNDQDGTLLVLDTGLTRESHGDHVDIDKGAVRLLPTQFTGDKPAHVVSEHGWLALFYDGQRPWERKSDPKAVLIETDTLGSDKPKVDVWKSPAPQHGIAIPVGKDEWILSVPNPAYAKGDDQKASSRPNGFEVLNRGQGWKQVASFNDVSKADRSCKLFHGHAALKDVHAFGCNAQGAEKDGGILILQRDAKSAWTSSKLAYPDERRTSTIKAQATGRFMVGNYGTDGRPYDALLRIDPAVKALTGADAFVVPGNQPVCQFEITPDGKRVANLTPDGKFRVYEIAPTWKEVASFDAVSAFDCAYGAPTPTPNLAIVGDSAFISDPINHRIREFHLNTLKQGLDAKVDGMPANLAGGGNGG
ncbi:hypothetical protein ACFSM5_02630 [Lacibacterium aquatile]|uniref:Uncharacterized protein n=1 Tax=Lacibacterium aquatile TaxID=1168082 RepID=A0ABW5DKX4_9PROT